MLDLRARTPCSERYRGRGGKGAGKGARSVVVGGVVGRVFWLTASHILYTRVAGLNRHLCFGQGDLERSQGNMMQCFVDIAHTHMTAHMLPHDILPDSRARTACRQQDRGRGGKGLAEELKVNRLSRCVCPDVGVVSLAFLMMRESCLVGAADDVLMLCHDACVLMLVLSRWRF